MEDNTTTRRRSGRTQLVLIALLFLMPLGAAIWLYYGGSGFSPPATTNHGRLLSPVVNLADEIGPSPLGSAFPGRWGLVYHHRRACGSDCREALYKQRQARLMLGNDMTRVVRVLLHGEQPPDTLFVQQEHAGLVTVKDRSASDLLAAIRPRDTMPGGLFLIDPLGNVVMYFPADSKPRNLVDDIAHLLELSRIG